MTTKRKDTEQHIMKVINTGVKYNIFPDDLRSYDELPADYYVVRHLEKEGFFLEKYTEFKISDAKIYGIQTEKAEKVISSFRRFNRNLGVILSGDKGIGKSLFSRLLGRKAVEHGYPVIIVDKYDCVKIGLNRKSLIESRFSRRSPISLTGKEAA